MLLAIDVGNTNIAIGVFTGGDLTVSWRLASAPERTSDELWVIVSRLLAERRVDTGQITGVILSSVVPTVTESVAKMVAQGFGQQVLHVDSNNTGLSILYEHPEEVGADRLVNSVAARALYGESGHPVLVVDFGTATTFDVISPAGEYLGGIICPGVEISADALFERAARLPRVDIQRPAALIGRTTVGAMQSGLFYGYVAMIEGIIERLNSSLSEAQPSISVATGGLAEKMAPEVRFIDHVNLNLTLVGLKLIWERNVRG